MRISLALALALFAPPALAADAERPTVVELYESQGCSSCPPANAALARYADRPDWLSLTFAVTYWDRLGWKDAFAQSAFDARQSAYARRLGGGVYTPEVVVNGRRAGVGADVGDVEGMAGAADRGRAGPQVRLGPDSVAIGAGSGAGDVWHALYEPTPPDVPVKRGENAGRVLKHRNIVRSLVRLGEWTGAAANFALPPSGGLRRAVIVQEPDGGPVISAGRG